MKSGTFSDEIAFFKEQANYHADSMEGANLKEFMYHEKLMVEAIDDLEKLGVKYNPMTGKSYGLDGKPLP